MKQFDIPAFYRSPIISKVKNFRKAEDPRKKDFSPTVLDFGPVRFHIARHFGFCFGVENAIEISYKAITENPDKRIFLLSQMIHNPNVNADLLDNGIQFLQDTEGNEIISFDELTPEDIVIIPAFGSPLETIAKLEEKGVDVKAYNTTCPFVEKVWNRSKKLGESDHSIIIHGKNNHEETRATFSHSSADAPSVVVRDIGDTVFLMDIVMGNKPKEYFYTFFKGKYSEGFDVDIHLNKLGVVNQTTMLATETQEIADFVKDTMIHKYGKDNIKDHFADTRDTLCYATNDNQNSTYGLMESNADLAVVVGGYNSSNTTHLVELLEEKYPCYFINSEENISKSKIDHFDIHNKKEVVTENFLPNKDKIDIILTSGASCPDAVVDRVLHKILTYFDDTKSIEEVIKELSKKN
ncbi:4-hydroxy-3-methylbut-2-enyl diphosphate reductase [Brumimicrobium aurantiacum]|uniref:4-hydroxy-3-methylbut-2-enyl diphosphate reductase n=1 Tax=Brumimicrobium aurantiacum TaxID=1737063 RepID=A0A3E1F029_9FLAO|nr:4-hydroxy-3-methylbut-2-enyl diphosphate reductase [Brumimicrobium aurantiacum]RFC55160.1 4-hydroxy-3-methylbut-2-enyl diphosphate reductase [Brumimicrobium aurantiacum]